MFHKTASLAEKGPQRANKNISESHLSKKFQQLYDENQKWKAKREKIRQERQLAKSLEELKECTFKPSINPELFIAGSGNNKSSFLKRETDWLRQKNKRLEELGRENQKKQKVECSFHPKISQNSYNLLHNPKKSVLYSSKQFVSSGRSYLSKKCSHLTFRSNTSRQSCSYKQIHLRKRELRKQLQQRQSLYGFNLLTQRKNENQTQWLNEINQQIRQNEAQKQQYQSSQVRPETVICDEKYPSCRENKKELIKDSQQQIRVIQDPGTQVLGNQFQLTGPQQKSLSNPCQLPATEDKKQKPHDEKEDEKEGSSEKQSYSIVPPLQLEGKTTSQKESTLEPYCSSVQNGLTQQNQQISHIQSIDQIEKNENNHSEHVNFENDSQEKNSEDIHSEEECI